MELKDALEIVLGLAEENALEKPQDTGSNPTLIEAAKAQHEALATVRALFEVL